MDYSSQIRALLRSVHRPHVLERNALGLRLKEALSAPTAAAAFATVVQQAFAEAGEAYRLHQQVLDQFDLRGRVRRKQAAADLGISPRQFFYLHAQAIAIVERHLSYVLQRRDAVSAAAPLVEIVLDCDPARGLDVLRESGLPAAPDITVKQLCAALLASNVESGTVIVPAGLRGTDAAVAHALRALSLELRGRRSEAMTSLEEAQRLRLDHFGQPHRLAEVAIHTVHVAMARHEGDAGALARFARSDRWNQLSAVEAALANGDTARATDLVHAAHDEGGGVSAFRFTATLCLRQAQIHLLSGENALAAQNAHALRVVARPHADLESMAAIVHARACIAMGSPLAPRREIPHGLWYELYDRALRARCMGDEELASSVFVRAACCGYFGIAAHASATLALLQRDVHRALDAWLLWLRGRHFDQGFDMMPEDVGRRLLLTEPARSYVHELAKEECAQWPLLPFLESSPARDVFWGGLLDASVNAARADSLAGIMTALLSRPVSIPRAVNGNGPSPRRLAGLIAILLPHGERQSFVDTFVAIVNFCNGRARRRRDQLRGRIALELSG